MGVAVDGAQPGLVVFVEPVRVGVLDAIKTLLERHGVRAQAKRYLALPFGQCPVPDPSGSAGRAREIVALVK